MKYELVADLSLPLRFDGPQPNAYGVGPATARSLGDTREGSSVNFDSITFIPHCNGTHTECVGHITDERISVRECLRDVVMTAALVSVVPRQVDGDQLIGIDELKAAAQHGCDCLVIRTLPNDDTKLTRQYDENNIPPYFSAEAMQYIVECGFRHLICDLPSIDRLFDDGKLTNHRIFWNVDPGSREINTATRFNNTITELAFIPDTIADGEYLLNLQIAPFESDAAPSRPLLIEPAAG